MGKPNIGIRWVVFGVCLWAIAAKTLAGEGRPEAAASNIVLSVAQPIDGQLRLIIDYPDAFSNRLDIYLSTNLQAGGWALCGMNLATAGSNTLTWSAPGLPGTGVHFYQVGNADLDTDQDGLADAREVLIYRTQPLAPDSDLDGVPDGAELQRGTDPGAGSSSTILLYADSDAGSDQFDGLSPVVTGGHGPKRTLGAAAAASFPRDVIQVRGVGAFQEPSLSLGRCDVTVRPVGAVWIQP